MPNWCATKIEFKGNSDDIKKLHDFISDREANDAVGIPNDFGLAWLGNYLERAGVDHDDYDCRGDVWHVDDLRDEDTSFFIDVDTAWVPMLKMWQVIIGKLNLTDVHITYFAVEPGSELYQTNDKALVGKYIVDMYDPDALDAEIVETLSWDDYESVSEHDLREALCKVLKLTPSQKSMGTAGLIRILNNLTGEDGVSILKWEEVPIEEASA